jgi:hypothetical protein
VAEALGRILAAQYRRYPRLQMADLYKLLHQASLGSEHAISDEAGVRAWLDRELATMGAGPEEPLIDGISPAGEIVRVHLRPYVAAGHDPEKLLAAFLRTAREVRGSTAGLRHYGEVAERMASAGRLPFPPDQVAAFMRRMEQQGFPAAHHSPIYDELYRPAYRVVARMFLEPVLGT